MGLEPLRHWSPCGARVCCAAWSLHHATGVTQSSGHVPGVLQERQREEAAKKKAEAKRLAAEEEAALAAAGKKKASKPAPPKVCGQGLSQHGAACPLPPLPLT